MEEESGDPYEEQLLAVFRSCLEEGETELDFHGLRKLCEKLELNERSQRLVEYLVERNDKSVDFATFRDGLLKLLNQTQGSSKRFPAEEGRASQELSALVAESVQFGPQGGHCSLGSPRKINGRPGGPIDDQEMRELPNNGALSKEDFMMVFDNDKRAYERSSLDWGTGTSRKASESGDLDDSGDAILGPDRTGYVSLCTIVGMWEIAGVPEPAALLSDLGFSHAQIRLSDLTSVLCEELKNLRDETDGVITTSLLKGALALYQEELGCVNGLVEQLRAERDKLRADVVEANERANLLAQEIDEHQIRLEKCREEQLKQLEQRHAEITRDLSFRCNAEREAHTAALRGLDRQLQIVQNEEQQVRAKLANVLQENQNLEREAEGLKDKIGKLKSSNEQLALQVQRLASEHEEIETDNEGDRNEEIIQLVERIKGLQSDLALLRDENDELACELEFAKSRNRLDEPKSSDDLSEVTDEKVLSGLGDALTATIRELKSLFESEARCSDRSTFSGAISAISTKFDANLRRFSRKNEDQEFEERASESLRDLVVSQVEKTKLSAPSSPPAEETDEKNIDAESNKNTPKAKVTSLRDYPPRKEEGTSGNLENGKVNNGTNASLNATFVLEEDTPASSRTQEPETKDSGEKKRMAERCIELERSLDMLRAEYEQCEDYWAAKLEEERQLFEQEQKISDEKFSELIAKMAEYEEQFSPDEKTQNDGRLSPIEEKFNLEQQYADLEEEYESFKRQTLESLARNEEQIKNYERRKENLIDAETQYSFDDEIDGVFPGENAAESPRISEKACDDLDDDGKSAIFDKTTKKSSSNCANNKIVEMKNPRKSNEISKASSKTSNFATETLSESYCQKIEAFNSMEELCRVHKAELHRLYQKKLEIDNECLNLTKQQETLAKGVSDLKIMSSANNSSTPNAKETEDGICCSFNINILKALNEKLLVQEKKRRNLKICFAQQQRHAETILQQTWQQHCQEVATLRFALQSTKQQLKKQLEANREQAERLAKADILSTDLYVQIAHLMANVKRLEQHCHLLAQFGGESTSV